MDTPRYLRDVYRFPGLEPAASVRGYPGDTGAIIVPLRRRRKKQPAASAELCMQRSTISVRA